MTEQNTAQIIGTAEQITNAEEIIFDKPFICEVLVKRVTIENDKLIFHFQKTYEVRDE